MNYTQNVSSPAFRSLNYTNLIYKDINFLRKDFKIIQMYGRNYDIKLTSTYADIPNMAVIDISVKPLKDGLNIIKRFFRPTGRAIFNIQNNKNDLVNAVENAIADLEKKLHK